MADEAQPVDPDLVGRLLADAAQRFSAPLDAERCGVLARYASLLLHWNRRINLTGARSVSSLVSEHLADALALLPDLPDGPARILDVGSGAGLPALVLAILRQDLEWVLLEPSIKKHTFLATACRELELAHVRCLRERLESHQTSEDSRLYDVAMSRATWPLPQWLDRARSLVRPGGVVLGLEGRAQAVLPAGATRRIYVLSGPRRAVIRLPV